MAKDNRELQPDAPIRQSPGIETLYRGVRFRSRLEARWAAFFDQLEWKWEYEPFDADGYIPDFVLLGEDPVLVEVKPAAMLDDLLAPLAHAISRVGQTWGHDILALGLSPMMPNPCCGMFALGTMAEWCQAWLLPPDPICDKYRPAGVPGFHEPMDAMWALCLVCGTPTFLTYHYTGRNARGRVCGHEGISAPGSHGFTDLDDLNLTGLDPARIAHAWAEATNAVRWTRT